MSRSVFICYAREDEKFVFELARKLKECNVPVWLDQWDIPPGAKWTKSVELALNECSVCLLVLSPDSVGSDEVEAEWGAMRDQRKLIVPVVHRECQIPYRLRQTQWVSFVGLTPDDDSAMGRLIAALGGTAPARRHTGTKRSSAAVVLAANAEDGTASAAPPVPAEPPAESVTAEGSSPGKVVGLVTKYDVRQGVVSVQLERALHKGDFVRVRGRLSEFLQRIDSIEMNNQKVEAAPGGSEIRLKVRLPAAPGNELVDLGRPSRPELRDHAPVGFVTHYFADKSTAAVTVLGKISAGDRLAIAGPKTYLVQDARSLERNHRKLASAFTGQDVTIKVDQPVEPGDQLFRL